MDISQKGSKQVGVVGIEDKREITGVLAVNMAGQQLPPKIIYSGTTEDHWSTESTMLAYIDKVIKLYINSVSPDGLFDTFAADKTESV